MLRTGRMHLPTESISCDPILNHLSNSSLTLSLIDILIPSPLQARQKGKKIKLRAGRDLKELSRDQAFLDSGALGGNFVSPDFTDKLKDKGFKIEKLDSLCSIATPDCINNLKATPCFWTKDNIEGHSRAWKDVPWLDSPEYKELRKTGKTFLGNAKNRKDAPTNREYILRSHT